MYEYRILDPRVVDFIREYDTMILDNTCMTCKGTGVMKCNLCRGSGILPGGIQCPKCEGTGIRVCIQCCGYKMSET